MLYQFIDALKDAIKKGDAKAQRAILNDLRRLGMDEATALILASEHASIYRAKISK